jgi:hypothetical protein
MVVLPRSEIKRFKTEAFLTLILAIFAIGSSWSFYGGAGTATRVALVALIVAAVAAIVLASIQILAYRHRSRAVIFHNGDQFVVATNLLHEGYKLRFFRDVLNESISSFSDEERERWNALDRVGYHAVFSVRNVRKTVLLPLCFMVFDEVFTVDHSRRWDFFDSKNTSEPTFSDRGVGPFDLDSVLPNAK